MPHKKKLNSNFLYFKFISVTTWSVSMLSTTVTTLINSVSVIYTDQITVTLITDTILYIDEKW